MDDCWMMDEVVAATTGDLWTSHHSSNNFVVDCLLQEQFASCISSGV